MRAITLDERAIDLNVIPMLKGANEEGLVMVLLQYDQPTSPFWLLASVLGLPQLVSCCVDLGGGVELEKEVSTQLCSSPHGAEPGQSLQLGEDYPCPFMALRYLWAAKSEAVIGEILQIHLKDICYGSVWFHMVPSPLSVWLHTPLSFHRSCIRLFPPS